MLAAFLILISGAKAFGFSAAAFAAGVAVGYGFRGKENKAIHAAGGEALKLVGEVKSKV